MRNKHNAPPFNTADWKIIWRVTQPTSDSCRDDIVFFEGSDERRAVAMFNMLRDADYPVRIEEVRCGPLPQCYRSAIALVRKASPQVRTKPLADVPGAWVEVGHA